MSLGQVELSYVKCQKDGNILFIKLYNTKTKKAKLLFSDGIGKLSHSIST